LGFEISVIWHCFEFRYSCFEFVLSPCLPGFLIDSPVCSEANKMAATMIRVKRPAMGCEFELVLCGGERNYLLDAADEAFEEVARLEEQMSVFIPTSELSYINAAAGAGPVRVEPRLFRLVQTAVRLSEETAGAFDVTAGALSELWVSASDKVPSMEQISEALGATGMSKVLLDEEEGTVRFSEPGMRLDLGALAKGYAVGQIADFLTERGVGSGLVSAGTSTVYALGSPPDDDAWTVGIRNPVERDERIASVRLKNRAISTSGSHERFVEVNGVRYSHIIDPRSGHPSEELLAASALAPDPAVSDALSTAFFILGIEQTKAYCAAHEDVGAVLIARSAQDSRPEVVEVNVK